MNRLSIARFYPAIVRPLLIIAALSLTVRQAGAKVSLDVLRNDGYGMAEIKRPDPNTLTVIAEINGKNVRLQIDTGMQPGGLVLHSDLISRLGVAGKDFDGKLRTATGAVLSGFKSAQAERVRIGNVELAGVPLFFGK